MEFNFLETQRLILREYTPKVAAYVLKNFSDNDIMVFYGFNTAEEVEKEKKKLKRGIKTFNRSFRYFHLITKKDIQVVGWCGYHTWYVEHDRAELGYVLLRDEFKNNGYLTEAIYPVINYGFHKMKLERIEAMVGLNNSPSLKILNKLNFIKEGHLRQHYKKDGVLEDSLIYSLLRTEFEEIGA